jgi:hypothetical protein
MFCLYITFGRLMPTALWMCICLNGRHHGIAVIATGTKHKWWIFLQCAYDTYRMEHAILKK